MITKENWKQEFEKRFVATSTAEQRLRDSADKHSIRSFIEELLENISFNPPVSGELPPEQFPDTEADGIVFCGKCGKQK